MFGDCVGVATAFQVTSNIITSFGLHFQIRCLQHGTFALYWIVLGVLSSVGLGSGLHTFVLFLGPHIMRVATTAMRHGSTAFSAQIVGYFRWPAAGTLDAASLTEAISPQYAADAWSTPAHDPSLAHAHGSAAAAAGIAVVSFLELLLKVAPASCLWGLGTAIGELPPYFIARAAAASGEAIEELAGVDGTLATPRPGASSASGDAPASLSDSPPASSNSSSSTGSASHAHSHVPPHIGLHEHALTAHSSLMERGKRFIYRMVRTYGFWAVLVGAAVPNPAFDLAGECKARTSLLRHIITAG